MPQVGKKKFPYNQQGEEQAEQASAASGVPVKTQPGKQWPPPGNSKFPPAKSKGKKKYSTALGYSRFKK